MPYDDSNFSVGKKRVRAVVQRVSRARVTVRGETAGEIGRGLVVLLGVGESDVIADAEYLAGKIVGLRIFEDAAGKMNLAAADVGAAVLAVSQFTLYGDVRRGKRPSLDGAAQPSRKWRATSTSISSNASAKPVCDARPDAFRK